MKKKNIFRLFANCILVKGSKRAVICDLQRQDLFFVPNSIYQILSNHGELSLEEIKSELNHKHDEFIDTSFQYLIENDLGFFSTEHYKFPKIELKWEYPGAISNAIIEVNSKSDFDFSDIFCSFEKLGCKFIQLRFYDAISKAKLYKILALLENTITRNIELYIPYSSFAFNLKNFFTKFQRVGHLVFFDSDRNEEIEIGQYHASFITQSIKNNLHCGIVLPSYFEVNINLFTESHQHNSCLNRKISIDTEGNIKNCPSMPQSFGNIKLTTLQGAIDHPDFKKYWNITKDQIAVCKDCEFRYICTDCRAYIENPNDQFSKPLKCGYNPYTTKWEEWSINPLKQKAIDFYGMSEILPKF